MSVISMKQLLEAGVHFGHQTRRWNPKMAEYIFAERNGIYIIDLQKTVKKVDEAYAEICNIVADGGEVLFVGTKKQAQECIKEEAERCGMYYVNQRWLGGMLTNFNTIKTRIARLKELEKKIGYTFENHKLLERAMMHSSYTNEKHLEKYRCNERLEFLGDAVLELISSEYLFGELPRVSEGELTKTRASMVCEPSLAMCARDIDLGSYLLLGKGEEATGGRMRDSITSDAMEALIGAIYLDGGFTSAKEFIHRFILTDLEDKKLFYDSKTILQEIVQANKAGNITYELVGEEGPDHNKTFEVRVRIGGQPYGSGKGRSKKAAEQKAAYQAIIMYRSMK